MVIAKWGAIITLPNIYGRGFLRKRVTYFHQKGTIIDVRQSPKYASVWKKIWFLIKMEFDKNKNLYTLNTFELIHDQTSKEILKQLIP